MKGQSVKSHSLLGELYPLAPANDQYYQKMKLTWWGKGNGRGRWKAGGDHNEHLRVSVRKIEDWRNNSDETGSIEES